MELWLYPVDVVGRKNDGKDPQDLLESGRHDGIQRRNAAAGSRDKPGTRSLHSGDHCDRAWRAFRCLPPAYCHDEWIKALGEGFIKLIRW